MASDSGSCWDSVTSDLRISHVKRPLDLAGIAFITKLRPEFEERQASKGPKSRLQKVLRLVWAGARPACKFSG